MQINKVTTERLIFALFAAAFLALMISFAYSPPGETSTSCYTTKELQDLEAKVTQLKQTLHECENPSSSDRRDAERLDRCLRRVADLRTQIKDLEASGGILCNEEICLKELKKCDQYYQKLVAAIEG